MSVLARLAMQMAAFGFIAAGVFRLDRGEYGMAVFDWLCAAICLTLGLWQGFGQIPRQSSPAPCPAMKLWRLANDGPNGEEDDAFSFFQIVIFVLAATAEDARSLSREYRVLINAPCEDQNLWLDSGWSTCREVPTSGEPGVIYWASHG